MKIVIEYDTVEKSLKVTEDGMTMPAVDYIHFYPSYDRNGEFSMEINQSARNENEGVTKRVSTIAKYLGYNEDKNI